MAQERGIGYWVTSALESNIGLNAIAQWCATLQPKMPQGWAPVCFSPTTLTTRCTLKATVYGSILKKRHPISRLICKPSDMNAIPFITKIARQSILIDGKCYTAHEVRISEGESQSLLQKRFHAEYGADSFQASLADFLAEWFDDSTTVLVHTSGSTGTPKPLRVEKQRMMQSAMLTVSFLGLKQGDTALLCMPLKYIAGKWWSSVRW